MQCYMQNSSCMYFSISITVLWTLWQKYSLLHNLICILGWDFKTSPLRNSLDILEGGKQTFRKIWSILSSLQGRCLVGRGLELPVPAVSMESSWPFMQDSEARVTFTLMPRSAISTGSVFFPVLYNHVLLHKLKLTDKLWKRASKGYLWKFTCFLKRLVKQK